MRSVGGIRGVLARSAPAVLVAMVAVGCGGDRASSQEIPDLPPTGEVTTVGELLPGDRRAPGAATVTTATFRPPLGRASIPVPARPPATRPPKATTTVTTGAPNPATSSQR